MVLLSVHQKVAAGLLQLNLKGMIDGQADLPEVPSEGINGIVFDLAEISQINSLGIRAWMKWIWKLEKQFPTQTFYFDRIPYLLLRQIVSISNLLPKNAVVRSLYLPYFCDACDVEVEKLVNLKPGQNKASFIESIQTSSDMKCPQCQEQMVRDSMVPAEAIAKLLFPGD